MRFLHMTSRTRTTTHRGPAFGLIAALAVVLVSAPALAADKDNPDWPCVWRKVFELDAGTIWDGPPLDKATEWQNDDTARKLSEYLVSRRITLEEAEAAIKKYADAQTPESRDQKLTELFAGVLSRTNGERKTVMAGIERFHKRQLDRAKEIEKAGITLPKEGDPIISAPAPTSEFDKAEGLAEKYKWDVRVFQERQQNIPLACEIPQLMDERAGAVARSIRGFMKG